LVEQAGRGFGGFAGANAAGGAIGALPMAERRISGRRVAASLTKRGFDLTVAGAAVLFFAPVMLLVAAVVKIDSTGPVLLRQRRTGLNGKPFDLYRFRATRGDSEHAPVTRTGRWLREARLDDLPLLLNILKGDMSVVGPRTFALDNDHEFAALLPRYTERFKACPGLVGLAEARGLSADVMTRAELEHRLACDIEYIETWSLGLDWVTLLRTVPRLFD
jgi:putative colanic acid biosynthesis UDP-glucose lipid carrier transferase